MILVLNLDNSVDIVIYLLFKLGVVILDIITKGTVSQILYLGPSSFFYAILKMMIRNSANTFPIFDIK